MDTDEFYVHLLLPLSEVPSGQNVSKRTGEKQYTVQDAITIYGGMKQVIKADEGCRFLVSGSSINACLSTTLVLWELTVDELRDWCEEQLEGTPQ